MDDLFGKVVVINMDGEAARFREVSDRLRATGTRTFERLKAVDGRKLTAAERRVMCTPYCQLACTPSMVGCALSHRKAWQQCVEEGLPSMLICEDDVLFTDNATSGARVGVGELPAAWDALFLGCFTCDGAETTAEDASIARMLYPARQSQQVSDHLWVPTMIFGMHAYAVSQQGARKLLAMMPKAANHVDWEMSRFLDDLAVFSVRPGVAYQTGMDTSSMGSKAPIFTNKLFSHIPLGKHEQDGRTLAWLCSEGWGRLGHDRIVVNKYFVVLLIVSICGWWRLGVGYVALDLALACLFIRFSKTASVAVGYGTLLLAVGLGSAVHLCIHQLPLMQRL